VARHPERQDQIRHGGAVARASGEYMDQMEADGRRPERAQEQRIPGQQQPQQVEVMRIAIKGLTPPRSVPSHM
jgi:hypothetical protein